MSYATRPLQVRAGADHASVSSLTTGLAAEITQLQADLTSLISTPTTLKASLFFEDCQALDRIAERIHGAIHKSRAGL